MLTTICRLPISADFVANSGRRLKVCRGRDGTPQGRHFMHGTIQPTETKPRVANDGFTVLLLCLAGPAALAVPCLRSGVFDAMSTDDAMRLVEVRDLLAGQSWFDLTQHRLDPPS